MANCNQPFFQPVLSIPLVGGTGCFFSWINEVSPKKVKYDHRLNMTLFRWQLTVAPECLFSKLRLNIRKMDIVTVSVWYLAQRLNIYQLEDIGTTISVSVSFHLPIRDGVSREPLPTGVSPPPDVRDALILEFISALSRQSRRQFSTS